MEIPNKEIYESSLDILKAIEDVRNELSEAHKRNADPFEMRAIHSRLVSLYAVLNVENIIDIMDYKRSA